MDIDKVINIIRESKKASKCPPGYKLDKKTKACVPTKRGKTIVLGYFGRGHDHDHDDDGKKKMGRMVMDQMVMVEMVEAVVLLMVAIVVGMVLTAETVGENEDL